jgi:multimeric flavodoxin WrbA
MKLLAILGCSKHGNTTEVVKYFERKLKENIECEIEYLYLLDYKIDFCTGCHNCIFVGEENCAHYLEVKKIEDKIFNADGLVLASPGYMFSVTGIMKNFLDHVAYNCHRPKYFYKKAYLIANCTKWQEKSVFIPMETWINGAGFTQVGKIYVDMMPFPVNENILDKKRKIISDGANEFAKELKSGDELKPKFGDIMIFHAFRTLCKLAPNILKADTLYFNKKNSYDKSTKWYVPAKISLVKHYFANAMEKKIEKEISKMVDKQELQKVEKRYITRL